MTISQKVKYEEIHEDQFDKTTVLYYTAPKEYLDRFFPKDRYPEAVSMEICVTVPIGQYKANQASVSISPTRKIDDSYEDYDWSDVSIPDNEVEELFRIAGIRRREKYGKTV